MPFLYIDKQSGISRAVAALHQVGAGHRVPLLQALHRGRITLLEARRPGSSKLFKLWAATAARTPAVALIGDDDCASPDGPDTWPIAPRMLRWARFILIHGGGQPADDGRVLLRKRRGLAGSCRQVGGERARGSHAAPA